MAKIGQIRMAKTGLAKIGLFRRGASGMAGQVSKCGGWTKRVNVGEAPAGCCVSGVRIAGERLVGRIVGETPTFLPRPDLAGDTPQ